MLGTRRATTGEILTGGLYAGLIGYAAVVLVVAALNTFAGRSPFYTAALFGSAIFYDVAEPAGVILAPGPVLAFNALHLISLLALGLLASWLVALAERYPLAVYLVLLLLLFVAFHLYVGLVFFAEPLLGAAGAWHIGAGSLAAMLLMGWYLWRGHPLLRRELHDIPMGDDPETR